MVDPLLVWRHQATKTVFLASQASKVTQMLRLALIPIGALDISSLAPIKAFLSDWDGVFHIWVTMLDQGYLCPAFLLLFLRPA